MRIQVLLGPGMWSSALPIVVAHFPVREKPATDPRCERVNFWMGGGGLFLGAHHPVIDPARPLHLVPPAGLAARLCASSSRSSRGAAGPSRAVGGQRPVLERGEVRPGRCPWPSCDAVGAQGRSAIAAALRAFSAGRDSCGVTSRRYGSGSGDDSFAAAAGTVTLSCRS